VTVVDTSIDLDAADDGAVAAREHASVPAQELDPRARELLFTQARTANRFTDEPVTDDQVRALYDLVKYGPTSMNIQPARITLVRSPQARERLLHHLAPGNRDKTASAPLVAVFSVDRDFHEHLPKVLPHNPGAKDRFADPVERERVGTFNAAIQLGYFIVGVRAVGLAAGPMTGFDAAGLEAELFPAGDRRVIAVVNIGRPGPDAWRDRLPRLDFDQVVTSI
jgi:3-hydroxypropanoate dehydrogenase